MKSNITLSLDIEVIRMMDDLKKTTGVNRSKMVSSVFTFFDHSPEQLDKILDWVKRHEKVKKD